MGKITLKNLNFFLFNSSGIVAELSKTVPTAFGKLLISMLNDRDPKILLRP